MFYRRSSPRIAPITILGAAICVFAWAHEARAQNFVAVTDTTNPIVTATVTGNYTGAAWADADGDGLLDLFIARKAAMDQNLGGGAFEAIPNVVTQQGQALGTTWADAENDGDLDLFTSGNAFVANGSNFYRNDGNFTFTKITTGDIGNAGFNSGWGSAFGDVDNDAFVDLVIAGANGFGSNHVNRLLMNNGDGSFTNIDSTAVSDSLDAHTVPIWSDYDLDGDIDLFIGSGEVTQLSPDNLFRNVLSETGSWGFERITTAPIATDLLDGQIWNWIDYDNDRDLDGFVTNYNSIPNRLYRNDGGTYVAVGGGVAGTIVTDDGAGLANVWGDFDNDGDLDCYVTNDGPNPGDLFINDGDGSFTQDLTSVVATEAGPHYGVTVGDYDRDGDLDLYVQGNTTTKRLYRNDLANGNGWIEIMLVGGGAPDGSNVAAIGARVQARTTINGSPVWQMREVSAQNSFNSMNMLDVHFGLGNAAMVDSLVVQWPAGSVDVFTAIPEGQVLQIVEGSGATGAPEIAGANAILLERNVPNPFAMATEIAFDLPRPAHAILSIHDVSGRTVRTLLDGTVTGGRHAVNWDARDGTGRRAASGIYFSRLQVREVGQTSVLRIGKLTLAR
jgi:hypothetical protein